MEFFKSPKDKSHKKLLWLIFIVIVLIGISFLWQILGKYIESAFSRLTNIIPENRIEIDPNGSLVLKETMSISTQKAALFARIKKIEDEPLTPYERGLILSKFSNANAMQLTTEEKATILEALNRQK